MAEKLLDVVDAGAAPYELGRAAPPEGVRRYLFRKLRLLSVSDGVISSDFIGMGISIS